MTAFRPATLAGDPRSDGTSPGTPAGPWWGESSPRSVVGHAVLAVGLAILVGAVLGLAWSSVAPTAQVSGGFTVAPIDQVPFGAEGVYAVIMAGAGVVSALLARSWLRQAGPLAVLGVVAAGIAGSVVTWRVGVWAGPAPIPSDLGAGQMVTAPLEVASHGLLLVWPILAVFTLLWIAALSADPSAQQPAEPAAGSDSSGGDTGAAGGAVPVSASGSRPASAGDDGPPSR